MPKKDRDQGEYNYTRFRAGSYAFDRFPGPRVGEPFPSCIVTDLDETPVTLAPRSGRPFTLETGSITCPMFIGNVPKMEQVARDHPEADHYVLYTREAHPGRHIGPPRSAEEKRARAERMQQEEDIARTILVDTVDGAVHRAIGPFPDLVYVVDGDGVVAHRSQWIDPATVDTVLEGLKAGKTVRRPPVDVAPRPGPMLRVLRRAGSPAARDLFLAIPRLAWTRLRLRGHHDEDGATDGGPKER